MEVGAEVWLRDKRGDNAWVAASITSKEPTGDGVHILITAQSEFGEEFTTKIREEDDDSPDLKLRNLESDAGVDNLINLPYLHEPAILFCLQERYMEGSIYTYTGPILIALNPFKELPLYTNEILSQCYNTGVLRSQGIELDSKNAPHVYAIADAAYRDMMQVLFNRFSIDKTKSDPKSLIRTNNSPNQSILISGESGAGKTESTKFVLKYLTTVGSENRNFDQLLIEKSKNTDQIMDKILQSNPILESFGNACTIRNANSSRFGKFIELNFNRIGVLIGGSIRTYLLEKVRLPSQQNGERNFHIFYQLSAGCSEEEKEKWRIGDVRDYYFTNQGNVFDLPRMDDAYEYQQLRTSLNTLKFKEEDQNDLFSIISAILHMGDFTFESIIDDQGEGSNISENDPYVMSCLKAASELLKVSPKLLIETFTSRVIETRDEKYVKKLTPQQASNARDAVCKIIYSKLFDWIVKIINLGIKVDSKDVQANISVLDIFGFESFVQNSFEQLCINYTNETLQQQFNQYIFKMEQIEYQKEKIEWSFIEFPDNKECLDLIEHKTTGILSMLDDECRLPGANDIKFAGRLYKEFEKHPCFSVSPAQRRDQKFSIHHYAGSVEYCTITFVDKNKDELPKEASNLMQSSSNNLLKSIFNDTSNSTPAAKSLARRGSLGGATSNMISTLNTVAYQFKNQLIQLMDDIYSTSPHYIRCLKPNDLNEPDNFNRNRITEQLRYGGVLEAVRVARSGFPVRLGHTEFYNNYRMLIHAKDKKLKNELPRFLTATTTGKNNTSNVPAKELCQKLIDEIWDSLGLKKIPSSNGLPRKYECFSVKFKEGLSTESIQLGITKIFLRKRAHDVLGACKYRRIINAVVKIQSMWKCFLKYVQYKKEKKSSTIIQTYVRRFLAQKFVYHKRRTIAASKIQNYLRSKFTYFRYQRYRCCIILLQAYYRKRKQVTIFKKLIKSVHIIQALIVPKYKKTKPVPPASSIESVPIRSLPSTPIKEKVPDTPETASPTPESKPNENVSHSTPQVDSSTLEIIQKLESRLTEEIKKREKAEHRISSIERASVSSNFDSLESPRDSLYKPRHRMPSNDSNDNSFYNPNRFNYSSVFLKKFVPIEALSNDQRALYEEKEALEQEVTRLRQLLDAHVSSFKYLSEELPDDYQELVEDFGKSSIGNKKSVRYESLGRSSTKMNSPFKSEEMNSQYNSPNRLSTKSQDPAKIIEAWRNEISEGISVLFTEGKAYSDLPILLKLNASCDALQFIPKKKPWVFLTNRPLVKSRLINIDQMLLSEIVSCTPSDTFDQESLKQHYLIHIDSQPSNQTGESLRSICLSFLIQEERDIFWRRLLSLSASSKSYTTIIGQDSPDIKTSRLSLLRRTSPFSTNVNTPNIDHSESYFRNHLRVLDQPIQPARRGTTYNSVLEANLLVDPKHKKNDSTSEKIKELASQLQKEREKEQILINNITLLSKDLDLRDKEIIALRSENEELRKKVMKMDEQIKHESATMVLVSKKIDSLLLSKAEAEHQLLTVLAENEKLRLLNR